MLLNMSLLDDERNGDDVTALLDAWSQGEPRALERLMSVVHDELRAMSRRIFRRERSGHTLQPTAVVNELFLKLAGQRQVNWRGRAEFFGVAATLMRRILVDHARAVHTEKRGGQTVRVSFDEALDLPHGMAPEILAFDGALIDLARRSPRQSRVVEMRVLVGLTLEEIAAVEEISLSTVSRDWKTARLFLLQQLGRQGG